MFRVDGHVFLELFCTTKLGVTNVPFGNHLKSILKHQTRPIRPDSAGGSDCAIELRWDSLDGPLPLVLLGFLQHEDEMAGKPQVRLWNSGACS